jgi:hypothetical protein
VRRNAKTGNCQCLPFQKVEDLTKRAA